MLWMLLIMAFPVLGVVLFFTLPGRTALVLYSAGVIVSAFYHWKMMRSQKLRVATGRRGMIGQVAVVISGESEPLKVRCCCEIWRAELKGGGSLPPGSEATVIDLDGLVLILSEAPGSGERLPRRGS